MTIQELRSALYRCKQFVMTPMQINILIGFSNAGPAGIVDINAFNPVMGKVITNMFSIEPIRRKAQMIKLGLFKKEHVEMPEFDDMELFKVFRDYDEDSKGFLEPSEFYHCLESFKPLKLLPREITTLTLLCDCEMDMCIDYAMIMTFFRTILFQCKFKIALQEKYENDLKLEKDHSSDNEQK